MDIIDRKTGKLVSMSDTDAKTALQSGLYALPRGSTLPVSVAPGIVGRVGADEAALALRRGASIATPEEAHRADLEADYGGPAGTVGAAVAGVARGAGEAFGMPVDKVGTDLVDLFSGDIMHGGDALRERLGAYQDLHPSASTAGELAGLVGAGVLTGGEAPLARLGNVAEGLVPRAAGRVVRGAVRGAAEGAGIGAVAALNEAALGDADVNAEKVIAGMGHGAFMGGALGAGFGGLGMAKDAARNKLGQWVGKLAPKDVEALAEKQFGYAPEGLGQRVQKAYAKMSASVAGKDAEVVDTLTSGAFDPSSPGFQARHTAVFDAPKIQEAAQREVRAHVDDMLRSGDLVSAEARGQLKAEHVERAIKTGNEAETLAFTNAQLDKIIAGAEYQLQHADGVAPTMKKALATARELAQRARAVAAGEEVVGYRVPFIDADAGLEGGFAIKKPFSIGEELRPMTLKGGGRADRIAVEEPPGLFARGKKGQILKRPKLDLDAGLEAEAAPAEDAFRWSSAKKVPRAVDAELVDAEAVATARRAPIGIEAVKAPIKQNGQLFVELDNLKRALQRISKTGTRSVRNVADPLDMMNAQRTLDWFKGAANEIRSGLEDETLWGKAALDQRAINAAWTKQLDASERFHRALTTETTRDPNDPYRRLRGADPSRVESYVRNLTNPNNDLTHTAVKDFVASSRELAGAISKSYDLPADKLAEVARVRAAAEGFERTIGKAEKALVTANQFRALTEGSTDSLTAILGTVGGIFGGLPGGVLGAAAGAVANPGRVVAQLASVERLVMKVDTRIGSNLRRFFAGGSKAPAALPEVATPKGFDAAVERLGRAVDIDGNITPAGRASIAAAIGDLGESAPKLAVAVGMKAMAIASFLAGKIPPAMRNPYEMFPGDEPPLVSDTERETFARYMQAVEDPMGVVDHLARGDVTPEEAEALEVCYPRLYQQIRRQIDQQVLAAQSKGKPLAYEQRVSYGVLFKVRTDATMDPEVLQIVANAQAERKGAPPGPGPAPAKAPKRLRPIPAFAPRFQTSFEAASSRRKGGLW